MHTNNSYIYGFVALWYLSCLPVNLKRHLQLKKMKVQNGGKISDDNAFAAI
jgi:hypothetical protein